MNRLIIVGNGFDLAHGLKTSYADFMLDYLKGCLITFFESERVEFEEMNGNGVYYTVTKLKFSDDFLNLEMEFLTNLEIEFLTQNLSKFLDKLKNCKNLDELHDLIIECRSRKMILRGHSDFSNSLLESLFEKKWVDIEMVFYQFLLETMKDSNLEGIGSLNNDIDKLKQLLISYLKKIDGNFKLNNEDDETNNIYRIMTEGLQGGEVVILNFNYTNVVKQYLESLGSNLFKEIKIHGNISDLDSIVFGYGDEVDKKYQEIEDLNENLFFEHIKSFKYFQNSHYQDLMRFVDTGPFEVYVMGHSLGLSDRTMFTQIFESNNLDKVHLFYYERPDGTNDFTEKTYEISRHFKDKGRMRKKIVDKSKSTPLPQFGNT